MKRKINICLFGRHVAQCALIEMLDKLGFKKPIIILGNDSTFNRDKKLLYPFGLYGDIEKLEKLKKVKIYKNKNVNSKLFIRFLKTKKINFGFSIASRSIFKKNIINYFNGNFYNLHDSMLPTERGGALNTWRILLDRKKVGNTIHSIDDGIDTGNIIIQRTVRLKNNYPKPIDYDFAQINNSKKILLQFFKNLKNGVVNKQKKQQSNKREYFSRLYTKVNGALDVDLPPQDFEKFVRAFSEPYEGAWVKVSNRTKIHIKEIKVINKNKIYPNFANGRVIKKDHRGVYVIIGQGLVKFKYCFLNRKKTESKKLIMMNDILRNDIKTLSNAKNSIIKVK